jgi:propane monooxygenase coupling protein
VSEGTTQERFHNDRTASNRCGVTLSAGVEGNIIADVMSEKPGVEVTKYPAMIRVDANDKLEFDMEEIAEALGEEEFTTSDFEIETSTHYGRMVRLDDKILLFANPEDAAEYTGGFDPVDDEPQLPA